MNRTVPNPCRHEQVGVTYLNKWADIDGISVASLQASPPVYPKMQLVNAHCLCCGAKLKYKNLKQRIRKGGDLWDARFDWCDFWPWWWPLKDLARFHWWAVVIRQVNHEE